MAEDSKKKEIDSLLDDEFKKKGAEESAQKLSLISKIKLSLTNPSQLFSALKNESVGSALKFSLITILPLAVLVLILFLSMGALLTLLLGALLGSFFLAFGGMIAVIFFILIIVLQIIGTIISAVIYHIFAKLLHGKGSFSNTLTVVAYTGSVNLLYIAIMLVSLAFMLVSPLMTMIIAPLLAIVTIVLWFRIIITGFSILHEMSKKKALLVAMLPIIIVLVLLLVVSILLPHAAASSTENQLKSVTTQMQTSLRIDSAFGAMVVIRNTGTTNMATSSLTVYADNVPAACDWRTDSVAPGGTSSCTLASSCSGKRIKVTSAGSSDIVTCE
ncbi:MAG: Yip1 family protein [Candidatus Aenigmarchaeota archaeon]|nr:Yip1 family protein [Candidatus Aenigmarchaeota archaeon]